MEVAVAVVVVEGERTGWFIRCVDAGTSVGCDIPFCTCPYCKKGALKWDSAGSRAGAFGGGGDMRPGDGSECGSECSGPGYKLM